MNCIRSITAIAALLALSSAAAAQTIPDNVGKSSAGLPTQLQNVGFEPQLNSQLPLDVNFRDESGREVQLREYFGRKPVLLALVYYGCPMLCNQVEMGVVGSLKMLSFNPARDYEVLTAAGWHFLTGKEEAIHAVATAANFRYSFDEKHNLFAHASGIMLLTPDGRISRYFYGVEYPSRDVRLGLVDASAGKIGTPIDHLLLFCFQYNPETARYSATVLRIVRLGGILTILTIVVGLLIFRRRDVRAASATSRPPLRGGSQQGAN